MTSRAGTVLLLVLLVPIHAAWAESPLEKAYRQEIQLLKAEKQQLLSRIDAQEKQYKEAASRLRAEVIQISEEVTSLRIENEVIEEKLGEKEEEVNVSSNRESLFNNTLDQAVSTLLHHGIEVEQGEEDPRLVIEKIFKQGCQLAERLGKLRVERGNYFATSGLERKADILWLSRVAATSLDPGTGGALGPAGSRSLKVVYQQSLGQARALLDGGDPLLVGMYLFDPLDWGGGVSGNGKTLWETFLAGGFVMWPILVLAVIALLILIERLVTLRKVHTNAGRLMKRVGDRISNVQWAKAAEDCHREPGAVARVLGTILRNRELPRSQLEELVNESILAERPILERFLPALNVIAVVAPLLGLLGTVTGMIGTFHVITEHGTGDPRLLSGGISEALLTTQFGLMLAIPTLLVHSLLSGRVDHVLSDMETNSLGLLNKMRGEQRNLLKKDDDRGASIDGPQHPDPARQRGIDV